LWRAPRPLLAEPFQGGIYVCFSGTLEGHLDGIENENGETTVNFGLLLSLQFEFGLNCCRGKKKKQSTAEEGFSNVLGTVSTETSLKLSFIVDSLSPPNNKKMISSSQKKISD
jgi:hypothetical protein